MVKNGIERQTSTAKIPKINYSKGRERCQCVKKKRRFFMNTREYCCYTRPYSEIEGLQLAHTLLYSASAQHQPGGLPGRQFCPRDAADAVLMRERNRPRAVAGCIG